MGQTHLRFAKGYSLTLNVDCGRQVLLVLLRARARSGGSYQDR